MIIGKFPCYTEVITAVSTKSTIFWVVMKCSPIEVYWRFGEPHWLHFQNQRARQANNQQEELVFIFSAPNLF
jgi:hypothetical protein